MTSALPAQVAPGEGLFFTSNSGSIFVDRAGTRVTGTGPWIAPADVIDPIDGSLWSGASGLTHARLAGLATTSFATIPLLTPNDWPGRPVLDEDSNLLVPVGTFLNPGWTYSFCRVDRNTLACTRLQTLARQIYALALDPGTWRLYCADDQSTILALDPPYTAPPVRVGDLNAVRPWYDRVTAIAVVPTPAGGELIVQAFFRFYRFDLASGAASVLYDPRTPVVSFASFARDRTTGDLWFGWGDGIQNCVGCRLAASLLPFCVPIAASTQQNPVSVRAVAVNDFPPGALNVAPARVPTGAFTLGVGLWGTPGHLGVLAVTAPITALLAVGIFDRGGNLSARVVVPDGVFALGVPGQITLVGADVDLASLGVRLSAPLSWPRP